MEASFFTRHPRLKDVFNIVFFVVAVTLGVTLINNFIFRSFSVVGPSMESTLYTGDRLLVNRMTVAASQIQNKPYVPKRGSVIVFKNPTFTEGASEEFLVKRVIGLPGDRVVVKDGTLTVYNKEHPEGYEIDKTLQGPGSPTSGTIDTEVGDGVIFVAGDHRAGSYSYDSRNGLGLIPLFDIVGPVGIRIFPFDKIQTF